MADRWQSQYEFWLQFGVPAYEENSVPDLRDMPEPKYPYITYEASAGGFDDLIPITASIWDRSASWENVDKLTDEIEHHIRTADPVKYDAGMYRVYIGYTTFAQNMGDPDDDMIKRKLLNVTFEFMQIKI